MNDQKTWKKNYERYEWMKIKDKEKSKERGKENKTKKYDEKVEERW